MSGILPKLICGAAMNELSLFSGAGGGLLATHHLLGWRPIGYVEMAEKPCKYLEARIKDELLPKAPIFCMHTRDFIRQGWPEKYRGVVDVITAGFPCQPFSRAGKLRGADDDRNGWPDTIAIIRLVRPRYLLLENVAGLVSHPYFGTILGDLAESGYGVRWDCIPASAVGANHERDRVWIVAYTDSPAVGQQYDDATAQGNGQVDNFEMAHADGSGPPGRINTGNGAGRSVSRQATESIGGGQPGGDGEVAHTQGQHSGDQADGDPDPQRPQGTPGRRCGVGGNGNISHTDRSRSQRQGLQRPASYHDWWAIEPPLGRVAHGVADRVGQIKAIGGGQVPLVVAVVWRLLTEGIGD